MSIKLAKKTVAPIPQHVVDSEVEALDRSPDLDLVKISSAPAADQNSTVTSDSQNPPQVVSASLNLDTLKLSLPKLQGEACLGGEADLTRGEGIVDAPNDWQDDSGRVPLPKLTKPQLERLKFAIVTSLSSGTPATVIAANYHVDMRFVERCRNIWLEACRIQEAHDWEHELKVKSIDAIREGLDCRFDQYKRMGSAIKVLQGLGYFKQDSVNLQILQKFENVPPEFRERYMSTDDTVINVTAKEVSNG